MERSNLAGQPALCGPRTTSGSEQAANPADSRRQMADVAHNRGGYITRKMFRGTFSENTYVGAPPNAGTWCPARRTPSGSCGPATRSRPGTATTPTTRRTTPSAAVDRRPVAEVVLQPQTGFGHPRPVHPDPPGPVPGFAAATARRDVRSDPMNPIASSFSWTASARIFPSTSPPIPRPSEELLDQPGSGRPRCDVPGGRPAPRTNRATVWWEHPANSARHGTTGQVERFQNSMISRQTSQQSLPGLGTARQHRQADFRRDPDRGTRQATDRCVRSKTQNPGGQIRGHQRAETMATNGHFVAAYGQLFMAANSPLILFAPHHRAPVSSPRPRPARPRAPLAFGTGAEWSSSSSGLGA